MGAGTGKGERLSATERRAQIVDVAYTQVLDGRLPISPEAVAADAGVSKPLVFHYFPTVADLQLAVFDRIADELVERLDAGDDVPVDQRLRVGIEEFVSYAAEHAELYLLLVRGGTADARLLAAVDGARDRVARLIGGGLGLTEPPPALQIVLRGLVGFIEESVLQWLTDRPFEREVLVDLLCATTVELLPHAAGVLDRFDAR